MTAVCGVYCITNTITGQVYIGSSINIHRRKLRHFRYLKHGEHENTHLQNAYNKYGKDAFTFSIVAHTTPDTRLLVEQYWLDRLAHNLYNICKTAGSPSVSGRTKSIHHRQKISDGVKQYYDQHPEHRIYLAELRTGKPLSFSTKQKMREAHKRGSDHHNSKLTDDIVQEIRQKYRPREYSYGKLAEEFGVDKKTIIRIIQRKTWTHLP